LDSLLAPLIAFFTPRQDIADPQQDVSVHPGPTS